MKIFSRVMILALSTALLVACSSRISSEDAAKIVRKVIPVNFEILAVRPLKEVPGLYEVALRLEKQEVVVYLDKKGKYVVSGNIVAADSKQNLTVEAQSRYAK
jgi:thiol:disulfide interchange protein DsbC